MAEELVDVLVPIPLLEKFSYLPPKNSKYPIKQGSRVLIPFGNRTLVGVIWGKRLQGSADKRKYKRIKEVLDAVPLLSSNAMNLAE